MANPILSHHDGAVNSATAKKRKSENGMMIDIVPVDNVEQQQKDNQTGDDKLRNFQSKPLDSNIDYITLQSSLSLLQNRMKDIERNIHELSRFKKSVQESNDVKDLSRLVNSNTDYLKEISYKGSFVKCPKLNWSRDYGINLDKLDDESYEQINEKYEIIKKDQLF